MSSRPDSAVHATVVDEASDRGERPAAALPDESGFTVEDDDPGVRDDEREAVFDHGTTDTEGGTGYGLAIVDKIASVRGWGLS